MIFPRLQRHLSDRNYGCRRRPRYLIFSQFSIVAKMRLPPGLWPGPRRGQTLGVTITEGPTELWAPGPRDPTIRHWINHGDAVIG